MPVMQNFRKIMERTRASYGLPASGPGADDLHRVLRAPGAQCPPKQTAGRVHAGGNLCGGWCAIEGGCAGGCGRKAEGVSRGEVLEVPDLWAADAQTGGDAATGRNRAGVRETGCAAPTTRKAEKNSADERETASAGCL